MADLPTGGALSFDALGSISEQFTIPVAVLSLYNNITDSNLLRSDALLGTTIAASFRTDSNPCILFEVDFLLTR